MTQPDLLRLLELDQGARHVLVVEDALVHYDAMIRWLESLGHTVTAFGEIHDLENGTLIGRTLDDKPARADVITFHAAFLDYYFPRGHWNGGRLARVLIAENPTIRIFGMSSVADKNRQLGRDGAIAALSKRELGALIRA